MAAPKKDRSKEIQSIYDNLKYCSYDDLRSIQEKVVKLLIRKEAEGIEARKEEIARLQKEIEDIEKTMQDRIVIKED